MLKILKTIGHGALIGLGIMVVFFMTAFILHKSGDPLFSITIQGGPNLSVPGDFKTDLSLVSYMSYRHKHNANQLVILGKIKNNGQIPWYNIEIQAELYNNGEFVDECREYVKILEPGMEENFKIVCGECVGTALPDYNKLDVRIVGAYKAIY